MNSKSFTEKVKQFAREEGADLIGIAPVSRYKGAPELLKPQAHMPEAQSVVVMAVHHTDASVEWGAEPNSNYPAAFQIGMIPKLDKLSFRVARFIEKAGHATIPFAATYYWHHRHHPKVPYDHAASFSHMNAFVAAGLGEYGWHGMVMSPEYGPRQRIVSVITSAFLEPDPLYMGEALCDRCGLCEKACWGANYKESHLLSPSTIKFKIEDKEIEYANINRWRCFWGEQCHLDMNYLSKQKELDEHGIFKAIDEGVERIVEGAAGYMCSSFKYCMAKPIRTFNKKLSPGPQRKKNPPDVSKEKLIDNIKSLAVRAGVNQLSIMPLEQFKDSKKDLFEGFRTEQFFDEFEWVISINRRHKFELEKELPIYNENKRNAGPINMASAMSGAMDIANFLDDNGGYSMVMWGTSHIQEKAAELSGWCKNKLTPAICMSIVCKGNLEELNCDFPLKYSGSTPDTIVDTVLEKNPDIDTVNAVSLDEMEFPAAKALRESLPEGKSLIAIGVELPERVVDLAGRQKADCGMAYQHVNMAALKEAYWCAQDICNVLDKQGYYSLPLVNLDPCSKGRLAPYTADLPDMRAQSPFIAATGAGYLGKSGLVINEKYGTRLRFAFVVTSADIRSLREEIPQKCPANCTKCLDSCSMNALSSSELEKVKVNALNEYSIFKRDEHRCRWARVCGLNKEEGGELTGWKIPDDIKYPGELSEEAMDEFLKENKDPIIVKCYQNPNHSPTQVERCLQVCPMNNDCH
jgi:epoxyqueuosine reductase QueG